MFEEESVFELDKKKCCLVFAFALWLTFFEVYKLDINSCIWDGAKRLMNEECNRISRSLVLSRLSLRDYGGDTDRTKAFLTVCLPHSLFLTDRWNLCCGKLLSCYVTV